MKVVSLVLTIKWRGEDGNMRKIFLDFFCTDKSSSADAYFVRQVWRVLLQVNREDKELANVASTEERSVKQQDIEMRLREGKLIDVLRGVTCILRTGDSGPHFHCRTNIEWESNVWRTYGIRWETHTLCKRHVWSECDAHGGATKRAMKATAVKGCPPGEAEEYASILNYHATGFPNCRAYAL